MPRKGHTEEQIIYALRQAEAGKKVGDVCREMGVSQQAFYSLTKVSLVWVRLAICASVLSFIRTSGSRSLARYNARFRASFGSVFFHRMADHLELVRIHGHEPCHMRGHRFVEKPRIAGHLHRHFITAA